MYKLYLLVLCTWHVPSFAMEQHKTVTVKYYLEQPSPNSFQIHYHVKDALKGSLIIDGLIPVHALSSIYVLNNTATYSSFWVQQGNRLKRVFFPSFVGKDFSGINFSGFHEINTEGYEKTEISVDGAQAQYQSILPGIYFIELNDNKDFIISNKMTWRRVKHVSQSE